MPDGRIKSLIMIHFTMSNFMQSQILEIPYVYNYVRCTKLDLFYHNNQGQIGKCLLSRNCGWKNDAPFIVSLNTVKV